MKHIVILTIPVLFLMSCSLKPENDSVVLKIENLEIPYDAYKRHYAHYINKYKRDSVKVKCDKQFIDKNLIVSDAYSKHYDTMQFVRDYVNHSMNFRITSKGGYHWNESIVPIVNEFKIIDAEKINKRSKLYYFDVLRCTSKELLLNELSGDTLIENRQEFNKMKESCSLHEDLSTRYVSFQWPFLNIYMYRDYLSSMKKGQVTKPLYYDGVYYYLCLDNIEEIEVTEEDKETLKWELQQIKELELDKLKDAEMMSWGNPQINYSALDSIAFFIKEQPLINYPGQNLILSFTLNKVKTTVTFNDFIEPYLFLPTAHLPTNKEELITAVTQFYFNAYLIYEAHSMGIFEKREFIREQEYVKHNALYEAYIAKEITDKIQVDSIEVAEYYTSNLRDYTEPEAFIVNSYLFNDFKTAFDNYQKVWNFYRINSAEILIDKDKLPGLQSVVIEQIYGNKVMNEFSKATLEQIKQLKLTEVTHPIPHGDKYALMLLTDTQGEIVKPISNVNKEISHLLLNQKKEIMLNNKLTELRSIYQIKVNKLDKLDL